MGRVPRKSDGKGADRSAINEGETGAAFLGGGAAPSLAPGLCRPWELKAAECPPITGDKDLIRQVWNDIEGLANTYIWQLLLSF